MHLCFLRSWEFPAYSNLLMVAGERYGINPDFPEGFDEQKSISLLYGISLIANNWADEDIIAKDVKMHYYFHTGKEWDKKENYDIYLNTSILEWKGV